MRLLRCSLAMAALALLLGFWSVVSAEHSELERDERDALLELEQRVIEAVNTVRQSRGLGPLELRGDLAELARRHSRDMIARDFFGHENPDGQSPFDRMRAARIGYRHAGENIAWNNYPNPVWGAVRGWMRSRSHRENLLNERFTHTGVGAAKTDDGRYFITQLFLGRKSPRQLERERREREVQGYEGETRVNRSGAESSSKAEASEGSRHEAE